MSPINMIAIIIRKNTVPRTAQEMKIISMGDGAETPTKSPMYESRLM
jgi:hypothetical protein